MLFYIYSYYRIVHAHFGTLIMNNYKTTMLSNTANGKRPLCCMLLSRTLHIRPTSLESPKRPRCLRDVSVARWLNRRRSCVCACVCHLNLGEWIRFRIKKYTCKVLVRKRSTVSRTKLPVLFFIRFAAVDIVYACSVDGNVYACVVWGEAFYEVALTSLRLINVTTRNIPTQHNYRYTNWVTSESL